MGARIALTGGGTGGHIIPALNIGDAIRKAAPDAGIIYIGNKGSLEERLAGERGYPFRPVWIDKLRRDNLLANYKLPFMIPASLLKAIGYLRQEKIQVVVGTGGYASLPAIAAARMLGLPYVLQDQNAMPGMVTRWGSAKAVRLFTAYPEATKHLKCNPSRVIQTGNPVAVGGERLGKTAAAALFGLNPAAKGNIFVTGGSGGALSINKVIDSVRDELLASAYNLIWQTGKHWDGIVEAPEPK